jgi:DNA-binding NtrC family response regulator
MGQGKLPPDESPVGPRVDDMQGMQDMLSLRANEKRLISQALLLAQGDIKRAAAMLKISRTTLYSKVRRYGLKR